MGHREQLLEGAKRCLVEKGYARTTARDIVAASETNLASIGYHFGSKENLLTEAMIEALGEWGDEVERVLSAAGRASPIDRLESMWTGLIESFRAQPGAWKASFEIYQALDQRPALREQLAEAYVAARTGLCSLFLGVPEDQIDAATAHTTGSFLLALVPGLFAQWMLDPARAPSGKDVADGLRRIMAVAAPGTRHAK